MESLTAMGSAREREGSSMEWERESKRESQRRDREREREREVMTCRRAAGLSGC